MTNTSASPGGALPGSFTMMRTGLLSSLPSGIGGISCEPVTFGISDTLHNMLRWISPLTIEVLLSLLTWPT